MECVRESNRQIKKYDSWMTVRPQRGVSRENVLQDTTNSIWTDIDEQMFICRFERQATTVVREETFDLDNTRYHLLLASGTELIGKKIWKFFYRCSNFHSFSMKMFHFPFILNENVTISTHSIKTFQFLFIFKMF